MGCPGGCTKTKLGARSAKSNASPYRKTNLISATRTKGFGKAAAVITFGKKK